MLTVVTPPRTEALTTLERARAVLKNCTGGDDDWLNLAIEDASRAVIEELDRPVARARVDQTFSGSGDTSVLLDLTPIAKLESVTGTRWIVGPIDLTTGEVGISDPVTGILWREHGWPDDGTLGVDLTVDARPYAGQMPWTARYLGGWLLPSDDFQAYGGTLAVDGTFTMPAGMRAPLLVPNDVVRLTGFVGVGNNGRFTVVSATDTAFVLNGTFTAETAPIGAVVTVRTLPSAIERAVFDTIQAWWYRSGRDQSVTSERIGDWAATYSDKSTSGSTLPDSAVSGLKRFKRWS